MAISSSWLVILLVSLFAEWSVNVAGHVFLNKWAVKIPGGPKFAEKLAEKHGFRYLGQIGSLADYYHFEHRRVAKRSVEASLHDLPLQDDPQVTWVEQQVARKRVKRDLTFVDTLWPKQWYLNKGAEGGFDMNIQAAWEKGYTGRGVVVTILDDGIEYTHEDLRQNYDPEASFDINENDTDPLPRYDQGKNENRHGTRCAGEVAATANNTKCIVGVAYNARIGGVRMLDGDVSDMVEAQALSLSPQHVDIYSASWGPDDNGKVVDGPAMLAREAFIQGVVHGRGNLGSIFVWASGNGGSSQDSCNCDGYTNSIFTLSISSTSEHNTKPWYLEECSSTLATTYSSGKNYGERQIITTDLWNKCTDSHTGTSASAPLAAAMCALALEANPTLTWRDMQYIVMMTARPGPLADGEWRVNALNRKFSHRYGYGLMDGGAMVDLAERWTTVPPSAICIIDKQIINRDFDQNGIAVVVDTDACQGAVDSIHYLEHVQAKLTIRYSRRGDLQIHLVSPSGTRSTLLPRRKNDYEDGYFNEWPFMSVHFWGENPNGEWTLEIEDQGSSLLPRNGLLLSWQLVFYGTEEQPVNLVAPRTRPPTTAPPTTKSTPPHVFTTNGTKYDMTVFAHSPTPIVIQTEGPETEGSGAITSPIIGGSGEGDQTTLSIPDEGTFPSSSVQPSTSRTPSQSPCHSECIIEYGCSGPTAIECTECQTYRVGQTGPCVSTCPADTFLDEDTQTCHKCSVTCLTCDGQGDDRCLSCHKGMYLLQTLQTCVAQCPDGFYPSLYGECRTCQPDCETCAHSAHNCTSCGVDTQLYNGECLPRCAPNQYLSMAGICMDCDSRCRTCNGPSWTSCLSCIPDTYLHNNSCVYQCPFGYFHHNNVCQRCHPSCLLCRGPDVDDCSRCVHGLLLHHGVCVQQCPIGSYETDFMECDHCDPACEGCHGHGDSDCITCATGRFLDPDGRCVSECSVGFYIYVGSDSQGDMMRECRRCHDNCHTCVGSEEDDCMSCPEELLLFEGQCVNQCPPSHYMLKQECLPCHTQCLDCAGPGQSDCTRCSPERLFYQGSCLVQCPYGFYQSATHRCQACHPTCASCHGPNNNECTRCAPNQILEHGVCHERSPQVTEDYNSFCDAHQFWDATVGGCSECHHSCATCKGRLLNDCLTCEHPRLLAKHMCLLCCEETSDAQCCHCQKGLCKEIDNRLPNPVVPSLPSTPHEATTATPSPMSPSTPPSFHLGDFFLHSPKGQAIIIVLSLLMTSLLIMLSLVCCYSNSWCCWYRRGAYHLVPVRYQNGHNKILLNGAVHVPMSHVTTA